MPSVLFVCSANQCRSPMAQALFKAQLAQAGVAEGWVIDSAGTWALEGSSATELARRVMQEEGLDIAEHRSKPVDESLLESSDLVLVMERRHWAFLRDEYPHEADKIRMLSEMVGGDRDIEDPVMGTLDTYRETVEELVWILEEGYPQIEKMAAERLT